jgi:hypothetical protein
MRETISVYTEPYTKFVIRSLVGIKGKSESEVASFILKDWMSERMDELRDYGITPKLARKNNVIR